MGKRAPVSVSAKELTISDWQDLAQGWIDDGDLRQLSPRTLEERRRVTDKLLWFLRDREYPTCGTRELRAFLAYVSRGHEEQGGRWGNERMTRPVGARTVHAYFRVLRAFCRWLVDGGELDGSPIETLRPPVVRADQVQPFTEEQVNKLLDTAKRGTHPRRDEALLLFMLDTGCRASEVISLRVRDLDLTGRKARILGKGNKHRTVYFGRHTNRALWAYFREEPRDEGAAVFLSDRGTTAGEALTRSGLGKIIGRLGAEAKLDAVRCSPHTFRHTMAVTFLRAGGNVFSLKELLGHTTLTMTNKYVALAQADLEAQHRQFSPADRLKRR
jgi:site-specific recombinase XerD